MNESRNRVSIIFGTRPEAIKLCPLVLAMRQCPELITHRRDIIKGIPRAVRQDFRLAWTHAHHANSVSRPPLLSPSGTMNHFPKGPMP